MMYVGMDVHKLTTTFCFYTPNAARGRQYGARSCPTTAEAYRGFLAPLRRRCRIVFLR